MGTIVVGVDGSDGSRQALRWAAEEARLRGCDLEVLIAWEYPAIAAVPVSALYPPTEDMEAGARQTVQRLLADEHLRLEDGHVVRALVAQGSAAPALLAAAADAELLVVGTRGHGSFAGMLLGSVSRHCTAHAPCPVVVVPSRS